MKKQSWQFITVFTVLGFIALQVPVWQLAGSKAAFTLFDFFGPIASGFIGTVPGIIAVFLVQLVNFLVHGARVVDAGTIIRFLPMLFAVGYFGSHSRWNLVVPLIAIIVFIVNPIGRTVWYFTLYWTIPIIAFFLRDRWILARALGSTFTAHAVGGALWIYTFHLPAAVWASLIPVVAKERLLFAVGITVAYLLFNHLFDLLQRRRIITLRFHIDERYLWKGLARSA